MSKTKKLVNYESTYTYKRSMVLQTRYIESFHFKKHMLQFVSKQYLLTASKYLTLIKMDHNETER